MKKKLTTTLAASLIAGAVLAPSALAQDDLSESSETRTVDRVRDHEIRNVDEAKKRADASIEKRFAALDRMREAVQSSEHIATDHAAALLADYDEAEAGLRALNDEIQSAETAAELEILIPKIAEDYRVFLVIAPKTWEVIGSDTIVAAGVRIEEVGAELEAAIERATEAGHDVTEVAALLATASAAGADAVALGDPVAEIVIDLAALDWSDPAEALLRQGRSDLQAARDGVRRAADDLRAAIDLLKDIVHADV